ncbi:permease [Acetivibrio cellulolyticus]|uniref:permease n=1 Tax=Acetivibrio cellulolyticus TaxID=35830 RepID=UPI0001E2EBA2|nr:permease [Acetivibrio cellulolyticus]
MMRGIDTIIFTGFLGAGKTTAINGFLKSELCNKKKILVVLCEQGEQEIINSEQLKVELSIEEIKKDAELNDSVLKEMISKHKPDLIIIELNGMKNPKHELDELENSEIHIARIVNVVDAKMYEFFAGLSSNITNEQIACSDINLINFIDKVNQDKQKAVSEIIKSVDTDASIIKLSEPDDFTSIADKGFIMRVKRSGFLSKTSNKLLALVLVLVMIYIGALVITSINFGSIDFTGVQDFSTIFVSLIMQAFPFLMVGTIISAVIQVFVSEERFVKFFPKNKLLSFGAAILSGFFLPLCDCAVVPVAARLIKKGVPVPAAVTFMLASPIVNPITIAATFYAFPGQASIAFYRVCIGVTLALAVGIVWMLFSEDAEVTLNRKWKLFCDCGFCEADGVQGIEKNSRLGAVLKHSADEFFSVGRFLILGAAISSLVQVVLSKEWLTGFAGNPVWSVAVMMLAAFLMSVCSTADAFIARSFATVVPMQGVMSFMVLGPLLDIKNVLMMSGCFKKRFIAITAFFTIAIGYSVLVVATNIIYR